jgi:hypothetical protein
LIIVFFWEVRAVCWWARPMVLSIIAYSLSARRPGARRGAATRLYWPNG